MAFRLRTPIQKPAGRRLRVLAYARYSKEEQDASSILDQYAYDRRFLHQEGVIDAEIEELNDPEMSGELVSRPGINKVREGIAARRWDLIVVEDSSRLFRNETACLELVETAVDQGIRVIAINDGVDTAEEDWDDHCTTLRVTTPRATNTLPGGSNGNSKRCGIGEPPSACSCPATAGRPAILMPRIQRGERPSSTRLIRAGHPLSMRPTSAWPARTRPG